MSFPLNINQSGIWLFWYCETYFSTNYLFLFCSQGNANQACWFIHSKMNSSHTAADLRQVWVFGTRTEYSGWSAVVNNVHHIYQSETKARGSHRTLRACVKTIRSLSFVLCLFGCDSAALVTSCLRVAVNLLEFVTAATQRTEEVWGLCVKGQDVLVMKVRLQVWKQL